MGGGGNPEVDLLLELMSNLFSEIGAVRTRAYILLKMYAWIKGGFPKLIFNVLAKFCK